MNVTSKMTLYDMLAMVISGFLMLPKFTICGDCRPEIFYKAKPVKPLE